MLVVTNKISTHSVIAVFNNLVRCFQWKLRLFTINHVSARTVKKMYPAGGNTMAGPFWSNGPAPGAFYNFPGNSATAGAMQAPRSDTPGEFGTQRSYYPVTTGTSVVGLMFKDGVIIAADKLISYGSLARFHDVDRVYRINDKTVLGVGGDFADFQYIKRHIDQKVIDDQCLDDKNEMKPRSFYNWLTRVMYNRRSDFQPLYLDLVIGGMQDGEPFLGHVNLRGRSYTSNVVATGYGTHLALPLLREYSENPEAYQNLGQPQANDLMKRVMEVLWYRDCRSDPKYSQAVCTASGVQVDADCFVAQNWDLAHTIKGY
ncbi:proteasome subunit beta type-4 isoform X1 [Anopheles stephensi]|uniref:proteasome subunit beta type-4 isoform X1 n=2 Tax=Anopheles stephensi TaxID=30069 RepID=UPI001658A71F|nr:proteasome subunit beta type-4 isoform X1 [Anopheles stephensi]